jgi:hypothetical protein
MSSALRTRTIVRPSRNHGPKHVILIDLATLTPVDPAHPCSCAAGVDGRYCWAVLETLVAEAPGTRSAEIAALILADRAAKSVKHGRHSKP